MDLISAGVLLSKILNLQILLTSVTPNHLINSSTYQNFRFTNKRLLSNFR